MSDNREDTLAHWVETMNTQLGTQFELEEPGRLFLEFEGGRHVGVDFPDGADTYTLYTPLGLLNSTRELPKLLTALQMNLYQQATAGGVIGLDAVSGTLLYSFSDLVSRSSPEILASQIDRFAERAEQLHRQLDNVMESDEEVEFGEQAQHLGVISPQDAEMYESHDELDDPPVESTNAIRV